MARYGKRKRKMLAEAKLKVDRKGRVRIPAALREAMGLTDGDVIIWSWKDGEACGTITRKHGQPAKRLTRKYVKPRDALGNEPVANRKTAKRE
jgi:AbrB family looped-hinge helix DNA binding protein